MKVLDDKINIEQVDSIGFSVTQMSAFVDDGDFHVYGVFKINDKLPENYRLNVEILVLDEDDRIVHHMTSYHAGLQSTMDVIDRTVRDAQRDFDIDHVNGIKLIPVLYMND